MNVQKELKCFILMQHIFRLWLDIFLFNLFLKRSNPRCISVSAGAHIAVSTRFYDVRQHILHIIFLRNFKRWRGFYKLGALIKICVNLEERFIFNQPISFKICGCIQCRGGTDILTLLNTLPPTLNSNFAVSRWGFWNLPRFMAQVRDN